MAETDPLEGQQRPPAWDTPPPPLDEVLATPEQGDLLCYCDGRWQVARRRGWAYPVVSAGTIDG
jgi:uncharacterized protein (DUF2237 family)